MAIGVSSTVSPKISASGVPVVQGPLFGISESAGTPFTILWANGERVASIPLTSLDEILGATGGANSTKFIGQRVKVTTPADQSPYGLCTCAAVYNRNGVDVGLLQNAYGYYFETAVANLEIVS